MTSPTTDADLDFYPFGQDILTPAPPLCIRRGAITHKCSGRVGPYTLGDSDSRIADRDNAIARRPRKAA